MLTLSTRVRIPEHVSFTIVGQDAFLLNTKTNKYFALEDIGARLWEFLKEGRSLWEVHRILSDEYEVVPVRLEQDLIELVEHLLENGLVELDQA